MNVARSFSDIASATIITDVTMVVLGFMIVFVYVIVMLGRFDLVQCRVRAEDEMIINSCIGGFAKRDI